MHSNKLIEIKNYTFQYPTTKSPTLKNIDLSIHEGEFTLLCGTSGSGKTTLLRQIKPSLSPHGKVKGMINYRGENIKAISLREEVQKIGFVQQKPQNQVVTDKVWHELAFGLESLGYKNSIIRQRVGEMASFFGIEEWFYKKVTELSGGQLQILNLASVMAMNPEVLVLDEPTSQLDPIAAGKFINLLKRINIELGVTVVLSEHRLNEALPISDRVIILNDGELKYQGSPRNLDSYFNHSKDQMIYSMPIPMRICNELEIKSTWPININEGRQFINEYTKDKVLNKTSRKKQKEELEKTKIFIKEVFFRYEKSSQDVLKAIDLEIKEGEIFTILGGNGAGKTTLLKLISKLETATRGKIFIDNTNIDNIKDEEFYGKKIAMLPQNPQQLFLTKKVIEDLEDMIPKEFKNTKKGKEIIMNIAEKMDLLKVLEIHPFDLSGGEQQRLALGKLLIQEPEIILMDEPTKGMDGLFKKVFIEILENIKSKNKTIIIVSHDVEFCGEVADRCALLFKGEIINEAKKREFFSGNYFYTTGSNKMLRNLNNNIITVGEAVELLKKEVER